MSREREHIIKTIMSALVDQFEYPEEKITPSTDFFNDLDFSQTQFSALTGYLEMELRAKIIEPYSTSFTTVEHLADYIATKLANTHGLKINSNT